MSNIVKLVKHEPRLPAMQMDEQELMEVLQSSLYPGASLSSIKMVIGYCKAAGLDPMRKPVHIVPMWDSKASQMRDVVMPGIGLYRTDAARTGEYAGITEPEYGPDTTEVIGGVEITYPKWCRITVSRQMPSGEIVKFTATEFWRENYAVKGGKEKSIAPNAMWQRRPYGQISKCAEAQALRKAFPEVGSQPTADEMEGKVMDMGPAEVVPQSPAHYPTADFNKNLSAWRRAIEAGKKTADNLIAMVETKGALTDEQKASLRAIKPAQPAADVQDVQPKNEAPAFTYAQVADKLTAAADAEQLAEAGSLIGAVVNAEHRAELVTLYEQRATEMEVA